MYKKPRIPTLYRWMDDVPKLDFKRLGEVFGSNFDQSHRTRFKNVVNRYFRAISEDVSEELAWHKEICNHLLTLHDLIPDEIEAIDDELLKIYNSHLKEVRKLEKGGRPRKENLDWFIYKVGLIYDDAGGEEPGVTPVANRTTYDGPLLNLILELLKQMGGEERFQENGLAQRIIKIRKDYLAQKEKVLRM